MLSEVEIWRETTAWSDMPLLLKQKGVWMATVRVAVGGDQQRGLPVWLQSCCSVGGDIIETGVTGGPGCGSRWWLLGTPHAAPFPLLPQSSLGPLRSVEKQKRATLTGQIIFLSYKKHQSWSTSGGFPESCQTLFQDSSSECVYMLFFLFFFNHTQTHNTSSSSEGNRASGLNWGDATQRSNIRTPHLYS